MQRVHLFELEDLPWVPRSIRDGGTDVLDLMFTRMGVHRPLAPKLLALVEATGERTLVDVCSGGGGGALAMRALLREQGRDDLRWLLTERYPNGAAIARTQELDDVRYHPEPVDAFEAHAELGGIRTMFNALHHFEPDDVQRLIHGAVAARAPLAFFDVAASKSLRKLPIVLAPLAMTLNMALLLPVPMLLVPFVRPFRFSRVLWTYLLPAIPLLFAWDGTVSGLRAYEPEELLELARGVPEADTYVWEVAREGIALCLTGRPRD